MNLKKKRLNISERNKRKDNMEKKITLKEFINQEIRKVTGLLIEHGSSYDSITLTKWLQSLQDIEKICIDRNRY